MASDANNSSNQLKVISNAKPIMEEAIKEVYYRLLPKTLSISDMGCSSGPNTFDAVSQLEEAIIKSLGHEESPPEFLIHMNDLPSNDFNTVLRSLPKFNEELKKHHVGNITCYAVPGSFYDRLFPSQSLHFVHSSYTLNCLSNAPEGVEGNKGNIYISNTSPSNVVNAYLKQFKKDFSTFLGHRAVELVAGGNMVLTIAGREPHEHATWDSQNIFGLLSMTINNMVNEGLIKEEKVDAFNIPLYFPSVAELKDVVEEEGSFNITRIGLNDVCVYVDKLFDALPDDDVLKNAGQSSAKAFRASSESLFSTHFGEHLRDEMFSRLAVVLTNSYSMGKHNNTLSVTLSLTKSITME